MSIIKPGTITGNVTQDSRSDFRSVAAAPGAGTANITTITINGTPDGGTFAVVYQGCQTPAQAYNVSLANLQAALVALPGFGAGSVVVTGTPGSSYVLTWQHVGARSAITVINNMTKTGNPVAEPGVVNGTPGQNADGQGTPALGVVKSLANNHCYRNDGTVTDPSWTDIGVLL